MKISNKGLKLIENFEGFVSCPYRDAVGVVTRGYGEAYVSPDAKCVTQHEAEENLRKLVNDEYGNAVNNLNVPLNQNQFDALCSFVYNLGVGSMQWDVGRELRARNYLAAAICACSAFDCCDRRRQRKRRLPRHPPMALRFARPC